MTILLSPPSLEFLKERQEAGLAESGREIVGVGKAQVGGFERGGSEGRRAISPP